MGSLIALAASFAIVALTVWLTLRSIELTEERALRGGARRGELVGAALFVSLVVLLATLGLLAVWTLCAPAALIGGGA